MAKVPLADQSFMYSPSLHSAPVAVARLVAATAIAVGAQGPAVNRLASVLLDMAQLVSETLVFVIAATPVFFTNVTILYTFRPTVLAGVIPVTSRSVTPIVVSIIPSLNEMSVGG